MLLWYNTRHFGIKRHHHLQRNQTKGKEKRDLGKACWIYCIFSIWILNFSYMIRFFCRVPEKCTITVRFLSLNFLQNIFFKCHFCTYSKKLFFKLVYKTASNFLRSSFRVSLWWLTLPICNDFHSYVLIWCHSRQLAMFLLVAGEGVEPLTFLVDLTYLSKLTRNCAINI